MSTSVTERTGRRMLRTAFAYLLIALFCALFGAVYEMFSHGVFSFFMLYAFLWPLAGGALPFVELAMLDRRQPKGRSCGLWHAGIAALTVGSIVQGVLEIYGTTNRLVNVYWYVGGLLIAAAMIDQYVFGRISVIRR